MTRSFACLVLLLALLAPAPGFAAPPDGLEGAERAGRIGWDLVVLRPLGLVLTAVSLVGAAVAYPVAWAFDGEDQVTEFLVEDPIDRTFRRPLGAL
ncbi:MAG: hypothetical protein ACR2P8_06070 [Myxococcota bacterium]